MKNTQFKAKNCRRFVLVLWLVCLHLSDGLRAESAVKPAPIIPLSEIVKRWQSLNLAETVAAAEKGDLTAQHYLGYYHMEGVGGKINRTEGMRWYLRAAGAGFPNSLNNLGVIYLNGNGVERDEAKAMDYFLQAGDRGMWRAVRQAATVLARQPGEGLKVQELRERMEKAARAGDAEAQLQLGYFLLNPPRGVPLEMENTLNMFRQAAEAGSVEALTALGNAHMETRNHIDYAQALKWHRLAAEKEQPASEVALGWMYFHGFGVERDIKLAVEWTEKGARRNHPQGWYNLGRFFSGENLAALPEKFRPDYAKAHDYLEKAVKANHVQAAQLLGKLIWEEKIPWRDKEEAQPYFELAKNAGNTAAREFLQLREMDAAANGKDEIEVLEKFAMEGNTTAIGRLAELYRDGVRVKTDAIKTFRYEAALWVNGVGSSSSILSQMTGFSRGYVITPDGKKTLTISQKEKDFTPAYQALMLALKKNDGAHFHALAQRYLEGKEVSKDQLEASFWLHFSAQAGNETAKKEAAELDRSLNEMQRRKVQVWLGWMKAHQETNR